MREDAKFTDGDLDFNDSDMVIVASDTQHVEDTIRANPGNWPENPSDGVAIMTYLGASGEEQTLARLTKIQLQSDGYQVNNPTVKIENEKITLQPNATRV